MTDLMNNIKSLREMTGSGFLDCKKALEANNNDLNDSVDYLRKKGLAKANKKASREAKEGAVGIFSNNNLTTIVQINTETDFAAKNEVFLNFMELIGEYSLKIENSEISIDNFNEMLFDGTSIKDHFKNIISKIGENIVLSNMIIIENLDLMISNYIHNAYRKNIGKIAVVLRSKVDKIDEDAKILGKNLCMHIAASKPLAMNIELLDKQLIKKEKEVQLESIKSSGKPENIVNKILDGKMKKFYSESTFFNQQYILDTEKSVENIISEYSKKNEFKIVGYDSIFIGA